MNMSNNENAGDTPVDNSDLRTLHRPERGESSASLISVRQNDQTTTENIQEANVDNSDKSISPSVDQEVEDSDDEEDGCDIDVKYHSLVSILRSKNTDEQNTNSCFELISPFLKERINVKERDVIIQRIINLRKNMQSKWKQSRRISARFESKNKGWLAKSFKIPLELLKPKPEDKGEPSTSTPFEEKSRFSKRREIADLADIPTKKMLYATMVSSRKEGQKELTKLLKFAQISPARPGKILDAYRNAPKEQRREYSAEEALAQLLDVGLSKSAYLTIRRDNIRLGWSINPSYEKVSSAKKACRPPREVLTVNEKMAYVPLQSLLEHTAVRIVEMQEDVIRQVQTSSNATTTNATLICTWGFDGSSGQSQYKQKFQETESIDSNIFATTLIPLRLTTSASNGTVIWNNRTPQSIRFCRPLRIQFAKETKDLILSEKLAVENEIDALQDLVVDLGGDRNIIINFELYLTVIDGKVLSTITKARSTQSCPICHANPSSFNDLENIGKFVAPEENLKYGISPLHAWIRLFEFCVNLSYRLEFKTWQASGAEKKGKLEEKKKYVHDRLKQVTGLRVGEVRPNSGTSNDGNTARRAFEQYEIFSSVLGIDTEFVKGLRTILIAMSSQFPIDADKFSVFCKNLAERYVSLYKWYYMPATAHKILIHGADIIRNSALPLGMMGEDAAESRNKDYRNYRLMYARKKSRMDNTYDVFNRAMDTSDPIISSISLERRQHKRKRKTLPKEVVELLDIPTVIPATVLFETENEDEESEEEIELDSLDISLEPEDDYNESC